MHMETSRPGFACCAAATEAGASGAPWREGCVATPVGDVPRAATRLRFADRWGAAKARWAVGRMRYTVPPGLCAVGQASAGAPVFVTANYKMSFDRLRASLAGRDGWVLVLEGKKARIADRDACMECGACARNCPVEALSVQAGVGCATGIFLGALRGTEPCCDPLERIGLLRLDSGGRRSAGRPSARIPGQTKSANE